MTLRESDLRSFEEALKSAGMPAETVSGYLGQIRGRAQPPFRDGYLGADDKAWLNMGPVARGNRSLRVDPMRGVTGALTLPSGRMVWADGRAVWLIVRDEFNVPYVQQYLIH